MDKRLKELRSQFDNIPTAFTEKDKQAIRHKIKDLEHSNSRKRPHLFPRMLTGFAIATATLFIVILISNQSNFLTRVSDDSSMDGMESSEMVREFQAEDSDEAAEAETFDFGIANTPIEEELKNDITEEEASIPGEATNTYQEKIELSEELLSVYNSYKASLDDELLKGLVPFDIFKLYHYADYQGDLEVQYALYHKEDDLLPDKQTFMNEVEYSQQEAEEFYQSMLEIMTFDEIYLTETDALIRYTTDHEIGFKLTKDTELNVWKVSWMPIQ